MDISTLNELYDNGTLKSLYNAGYISGKIFIDREIYLWVDAQVSTRAVSKRQVVLEASIKFNMDERTIWRALKRFSN